MSLGDRFYRFTIAADNSGPMWEVYARRLGTPIVLGVVLGLAVFALISVLPSVLAVVLVIALMVGLFVWLVRQLQWVARQKREIAATQERMQQAWRERQGKP